MAKLRAFDVYLEDSDGISERLIDTVFYTDSRVDVEDVKRSLVNHDGYDPDIRVEEQE